MGNDVANRIKSVQHHMINIVAIRKTQMVLNENKLNIFSIEFQIYDLHCRLQVESYIHNLFITSPLLRDIPSNAPPQGI